MTEGKDDGLYNLDLATADEILVRAGQGEIARALRLQTQGNRNLIQGEWGMAVTDAFKSILETQVVKILASVQSRLDEQHDMVQQLLDMQKASDKNAKRALAVAKETGLGLKKLSGDVSALSSAMAESKADRADLRQRLNALTADLDAIRATLAAHGDGDGSQ